MHSQNQAMARRFAIPVAMSCRESAWLAHCATLLPWGGTSDQAMRC